MARITHARQLGDLPTPRHTLVMAEIEQQTDRGAAIIGAAYVDLVLREAITARMLSVPDVITLLFENRGPLQDFGARIQIGVALGVYGRRAYKDLCIIKDIRNAFAHSAEAMDFTRVDVARLCTSLWYPEKIQYHNRPKPTTPKELYVRAIELLTDGLHENLMRRGRGMVESNFLMLGPVK
jgi:DNA-binding MltR family transcriptional regulator